MEYICSIARNLKILHFNNYVDGVPVLFADFFADGFQYADDVANLSVWLFYAHVYNAAIVGLSVIRMYLYAALSKFFLDIPRNITYAPPLSGSSCRTSSYSNRSDIADVSFLGVTHLPVGSRYLRFTRVHILPPHYPRG